MLRAVIILLTLEGASAGVLNNCHSCTVATVCNTCMSGFSVYGAVTDCQACPVGATSCTSASVATFCKSGYLKNGNVCDACQVANCDNCLGDKTKCTANGCKTGFYYVATSNSCAACPANCNSCTAANVCTAAGCSSGFYHVATSNSCAACSANCKACTSATTCTTCNDGYRVNANACTACISGCKECADATTCTTCKTGYRLVGTTCTACPANCGSCDANGCLTCNSMYSKNAAGSTVCHFCNAKPIIGRAFAAQALGMIWILMAQVVCFVSM